MNLLITHRPSHEIRAVLEREMALRVMDFQLSQNVLRAVARLTPSFGLAGTVISLIRVFNTSQSIDDVTPLMAVAMMSTFYGVIISNLFMLPLCAKLEERALLAEAHMNGIIEGIVAMNELQNPMHIEERISGNYEFAEAAAKPAEARPLPVSKLRQSAHAA
jgi:chemotaxis protein MotA